ncbi:hypothetical protein [Kribbella sp. NPDC048928]
MLMNVDFTTRPAPSYSLNVCVGTEAFGTATRVAEGADEFQIPLFE